MYLREQLLSIHLLDYFIATHYDADHIGGIVPGASHLHGQGFVFGWDNAPGDADSDDDGDGHGHADWLGSGLTMQEPDPEELGTGDDIKVSNFVRRPGKFRSRFAGTRQSSSRTSLSAQTVRSTPCRRVGRLKWTSELSCRGGRG